MRSGRRAFPSQTPICCTRGSASGPAASRHSRLSMTEIIASGWCSIRACSRTIRSIITRSKTTVRRRSRPPISCALLTAAGTRRALSISTRLSPARAPPEHGAAAVAAALVIAACCRHVLAGIPPREKKTPMANEPLIGVAGPGAVGAAAPVKDVSTANFMAEVVDASFEQPVIVDFWAPWCGPCKQLGPVLEKVVRGANGAVRMVKLNIDENPEIAQQMRIQSIPAVYAFKDGRPVDGFVGALPESQVKQFVQRLGGGSAGPSPVEEAMAMAKEAAQAGDHGTASAIYSQILQREPESPEALGGLARAMIARGELDQAREVLGRAGKDNAKHAEITSAQSALELAEQAEKAMGSAGQLRARPEQNPDDHEARLELATALFGAGDREEAIDELLGLYKRDRNWNEEAARKQLVKFFEVMGPTDPLTLSARRRLSSLMFS